MRAWRSRRGISQEELGERAGLHRTYVSDIERGARNVSLESIEKLAAALEISVATLFTQTGSAEGQCQTGVAGDELVDILFVEDNGDDAQLALEALKQARIANRVHLVRDGAAALQHLFGANENARPAKLPDLILLDLNLPKIDGLEVLRRIKADPRTKCVPVIVLTGSRHDADVRMSKRLGAEGYIVKPVGLQNLSEVTPQLSLQWALLKSARDESK